MLSSSILLAIIRLITDLGTLIYISHFAHCVSQLVQRACMLSSLEVSFQGGDLPVFYKLEFFFSCWADYSWYLHS
jgi:hypothetical protein